MNPFRQLLKSAGSHPPIGTWIMSASPLVAEAVGHAGFDWGVIDMEHSPLDMARRGAPAAGGRQHQDGAGGARALERRR